MGIKGRGDNKLRGRHSNVISNSVNNVGVFQGSPLSAQPYIIYDDEITNQYKKDLNKHQHSSALIELRTSNIE